MATIIPSLQNINDKSELYVSGGQLRSINKNKFNFFTRLFNKINKGDDIANKIESILNQNIGNIRKNKLKEEISTNLNSYTNTLKDPILKAKMTQVIKKFEAAYSAKEKQATAAAEKDGREKVAKVNELRRHNSWAETLERTINEKRKEFNNTKNMGSKEFVEKFNALVKLVDDFNFHAEKANKPNKNYVLNEVLKSNLGNLIKNSSNFEKELENLLKTQNNFKKVNIDIIKDIREEMKKIITENLNNKPTLQQITNLQKQIKIILDIETKINKKTNPATFSFFNTQNERLMKAVKTL